MFPPCNMLGPVLWRWLCVWGGADGVVRITMKPFGGSG